MLRKFLQILFYLYAYIFLFIGFLRLWALFLLEAQPGLYFQILCSFDNTYYFAYMLSILQIIITIIHFIPLICYLAKTYFLPARFWQYLFFLRIIFDIAGHSLEVNHFLSLWHTSRLLGLLAFIQYTSLYIPSYVGCFRFAFQRNELQLELFKN